nr:RNA-directed DNA polymerase, eukaryota [Tanacetum cinerariifolium]
GVGARTLYYARKDFLDCHLPGEWEIARDAKLNPFKDARSYKPRPCSDGVGARTLYYARKDFLDCHLPREWEIARDAELNPFKAADSIGCSILNNQFRYLGVMVGDNMSRVKAWDDIILKIKSSLSKWKVKTLSIGGRLTLLKSFLGASPIYAMSIFTVPRGVLKALESIRNRFFNGADQSDHKIT